jgi:hypothetical protein
MGAFPFLWFAGPIRLSFGFLFSVSRPAIASNPCLYFLTIKAVIHPATTNSIRLPRNHQKAIV